MPQSQMKDEQNIYEDDEPAMLTVRMPGVTVKKFPYKE